MMIGSPRSRELRCDSAGNDEVASVVGVIVGSERRRRAHPRTRTSACHVFGTVPTFVIVTGLTLLLRDAAGTSATGTERARYTVERTLFISFMATSPCKVMTRPADPSRYYARKGSLY